MGTFWPLLYPVIKFDTAFWHSVLVALGGYVIVFATLGALWRFGRPTAYAAVISLAMYLGVSGVDRIMPFFGVAPVIGGAFYFPFAVMAVAMAQRQFGPPQTLNILYGSFLGLAFLTLGLSRWFLSGLIEGYGEDGTYTAEVGRALRDAFLATVVLFLGGVSAILIKKGLSKHVLHPWRFLLAVGFVCLLFSVPITYLSVLRHPDYEAKALGLLFNTYVAQYSTIWPVFLYMLVCQKWSCMSSLACVFSTRFRKNGGA